MSGSARRFLLWQRHAPWSCYRYAVSTGEFRRLQLPKNVRMLTYCGVCWKLHILQIWSCICLKALREINPEKAVRTPRF
jgi:hypothetical protein